MKRVFTVAAALGTLLLWAATAHAQANAANYTFTTTTTGSLTDMSSGTTQLLAANLDDSASTVTAIGFDFYFMGTRYTQFSVNSNGSLRLGATVVGGGNYHPLAAAGASIITAYGADQRTHLTGKVHFKVLGSAPNRTLVVEWLNMQANYASGGTADLTYQVQLSETTGCIQFAYGSMTMSTLGAADANSNVPHIGFSSNNAAGTVGSIAAPISGIPAPTFDGASATPAVNTYNVAGPITVLTSPTDGSRRTFQMCPPAANAPGGPMTFTGVTATGMTLNWTDSANELGYAVFISTDGINFAYHGAAAQNATTYPVTGLLGSTPYTWNVVAYTEGSTATLTGAQSTAAPGPIATVGAGGLWSVPATWSTGVVPTVNDAVTIGAGATVSIDIAAAAYSVTVAGTGTLEFEQATARTLTVATDVTVQSGGLFRSNTAGTVTTHVLSLGGNLVVDGALDLSTNGNTAGAGLTFTGAANASASGTGTIDVRALTVNKGTSSASILELMPSNFTVQGVTTDVAGFLTLTNGTFKLSGGFAGTNRVFMAAAYTIPATGGFWLNNPGYTVGGQNGSPTNNGLFRLTQGVYMVGTASGNSIGGGAGAVFTIEGGQLNVAGRLNSGSAVTYNQSGGFVNVSTVGNTAATASFGLTSTSAVFNMTGGFIVLVQASTNAAPLDFQNSGSVPSGGTLQIGSSVTATNFTFRIRGNLPNVVIDTAGTTKSVTAANTTNFMLGNVTIPVGSTYTLNGYTTNIVGGNLVNNGVITGTTTSSRLYFQGTSAQIYSGTGTAGIAGTPLQGIGVANAAGVTVQSPIVTLRVNLFFGNITGANLITIGDGAATTGTVQVSQAGSLVAGGSFDAAPVWNLGTGGEVLLLLQEPALHTTGFEVNTTRALAVLQVDNTNHVAIAGGDLTVNGTGAGALTMTNGRIVTGANALYFNSATGTVVRTNGYVHGNFKKSYAAVASKTFEVGTVNGYSPVLFNVTAGTFPADVTVAATQSTSPNILPVDKAITRYWTLTATGLTADLTFTYLDPADIPATVTEANLHVYRYDPGVYTDLLGTINTTNNTGAVTGVSTFSIWTLAEAGATPVELVMFDAD